MGTESRRQELMKLCGLCDEALRELEAAAGSGERIMRNGSGWQRP